MRKIVLIASLYKLASSAGMFLKRAFRRPKAEDARVGTSRRTQVR